MSDRYSNSFDEQHERRASRLPRGSLVPYFKVSIPPTRLNDALKQLLPMVSHELHCQSSAESNSASLDGLTVDPSLVFLSDVAPIIEGLDE